MEDIHDIYWNFDGYLLPAQCVGDHKCRFTYNGTDLTISYGKVILQGMTLGEIFSMIKPEQFERIVVTRAPKAEKL